MEIDWEIPILLKRLLNAQDVREDLAFVIRGTTGKNVAVF